MARPGSGRTRDRTAPPVARTAFRSSRALDFASVEELTRETGLSRESWPLVIVKELVDNALDACEEAGIAPTVAVRVAEDLIAVTDNGPGIPAAVVEGVVDFDLRVSSRAAYVAPDRGAQGNALKTILAIPFVLDGTASHVEIAARGVHHRISFGLDALRRRPEVRHDAEAAPDVRTGTAVRVRWPRSASRILSARRARFLQTAATYAFFNPHLSLAVDWFGDRAERHPAADPGWTKWRPSRPSSAHWYTTERLTRLITAQLAHDEDAGRTPARTAREFVAQFAGLTGSAKQKEVLDATGLHRAPLRRLLGADGLDGAAARGLLDAMRAASKPVPPQALGLLGAAAFRARFDAAGIEPESFEYRRRMGTTAGGLPWVVEVAFGWCPEADERRLVTGVNWAPGLINPFRELVGGGDGLDGLLANQWADEDEPVLIAVHLAIPGASYTDRGKTALAVPREVGAAIVEAVTAATKRWARQRRAEDRHHSAELRRRDALARAREERVTLKAAAQAVMAEAYTKASAGGALPANARQIYYAARPTILALTGKDQLDDDYFTQTLLPDFVAEHPDETAGWDVVFDARGHLSEPHTGRSVPLGTIEVREYLGERPLLGPASADGATGFAWPTSGPRHRFGAVVFCEKEGFDPLFRAAGLAARWDIAIMSTKGMSVTAARMLLDRLAEHGLKVLVVHDFDVAGFSIFGTLAADTRRYTYENALEIVDVGLHLADVHAWDLQDEPVSHKGDWGKKAATLRRHGATEAEIGFLRTRRVELNAFTSDQLVAWLEGRLEAHGVAKVVPDGATLERAARAAYRLRLEAAARRARAAEIARRAAAVALPADLEGRVEALLRAHPTLSWDAAIAAVADDLPLPDLSAGPGSCG